MARGFSVVGMIIAATLFVAEGAEEFLLGYNSSFSLGADVHRRHEMTGGGKGSGHSEQIIFGGRPRRQNYQAGWGALGAGLLKSGAGRGPVR
jgi:hypothetical protein